MNNTKHSFVMCGCRLLILFTLLLSFFSSISLAGEYYVSPTGSSAWNECLVISTPCSPGKAMENAVAGDIVYFRGGKYDLYYDSNLPQEYYWYRGILNPSNSGTPDSPIIFMAYPGETPELNAYTNSVFTDIARALGNGVADYIVFDGFTIMANNGEKMGGIVITGNGKSGRAMGNVVKNMIFNGGTSIIVSTDNREGIRLEKTTNTLIQNCVMFNYRQKDNWANTAAIKMYFNNYVTIENMEIYNSSAGIYLKADVDNSIFRNNFLRDNYSSLLGQVYSDRSSDNNSVYNNVIVNNSYIGLGVIQGGEATTNGWNVYNNTIYNAKHGIIASKGDWKIWNNIIVNIEARTIWRYEGNILVESDYNQFGPALNIINRIYKDTSSTYTSLTAWQVSTELLEGGGNPGSGSLASNLIFANESGAMSELNDFRLDALSPSKGGGRGGVDMGAFIDSVGAKITTQPVPRPVTNVVIRYGIPNN